MAIVFENIYPFTSNVTIAKRIDSANAGDIVPLYTPAIVPPEANALYSTFSGFLASLRAKIEIPSLASTPIPAITDFSSREEILQIAYQQEWVNERKELRLLLDAGFGYEEIARVSLLNRSPFYMSDLMKFLTSTGEFALGNNARLAVQVRDVGWGYLSTNDSVIIYGSVREESWFRKEKEFLPQIFVSSPENYLTVNVEGTSTSVPPTTGTYLENTDTLFGWLQRTNTQGARIVDPEIADNLGAKLASKQYPIRTEFLVLPAPTTITSDTFVGNALLEDTHMVCIRVGAEDSADLGDLTIRYGATLTTNTRKLGLIILCKRLILEGTMTMTGKGANHSGLYGSGGKTDVTGIKFTDNFSLPGLGGNGGVGGIGMGGQNAFPGGNGGGSGSGGGASGSNFWQATGGRGGNGAQGTIFAGGAGGGGNANTAYPAATIDAEPHGGRGGWSPGYAQGAGNQPGGDTASLSRFGVGGLLAIYASEEILIDSTGVMESKGTNWYDNLSYISGSVPGSSGGGIIALISPQINNNGLLNADGGAANFTSAAAPKDARGGDGSILLISP